MKEVTRSVVVLVALAASVVLVQAEWTATYDYSGDADQAVAAATDGRGNTFVLTNCGLDDDPDVVVLKYDSLGDLVGTWTYDDGDDLAVDFAVAPDGPRTLIYVLVSVDEVEYKLLLADGNVEEKFYWVDDIEDADASEYPAALSLHKTASNLLGAVVVTTGDCLVDTAESEADFLVRCYKTDTLDDTTCYRRWTAAFDWGYIVEDASRDDVALAVVADRESSENIYVAGKSGLGFTAEEDDDVQVSLVKFSGYTGDMVWTAHLDDPTYDEADLLQVIDMDVGEYVYVLDTYLAPEDSVHGDVNFQTRISRYGKYVGGEGNVFQDEYGLHETPAALAVQSGSQVVVLTQTVDTSDSPLGRINTTCYTSGLLPTPQWGQSIYLGTVDSVPTVPIDLPPGYARALTVDASDNVYIVGTHPSDSGSIVTAMYQSDGVLRQTWLVETTGPDSAADVVVLGSNKVVVVGSGRRANEDDTSSMDIVVECYDISVDWEWTEQCSMPSATSGKPVKRGGWLAFNPGDSLIYAAKGYKTSDFYSYNPATDTWTELADVLPGTEGKMPQKGCKGISDGDNLIYMTKGYNTFGYWQYKIDADSWTQLTDVPEGWTRKKVKGGTDLVYVTHDSTDYVYMLKGYKTEFWRYNVGTGTWESRADAPTGIKYKWNKGSWIVYDGDATIYAHKARYYNRATYKHEFWKYDIPGDSWYTTPLAGMPLYGLHSGRIRKKKAKDGGAGAMYGNEIWALKGGNTQQFWMYNIVADTWTEQDTVPTNGSTGDRKKRVKYGADLVHWGGGVFFALKGNKTVEMWRYLSDSGSFVGGRSVARAGSRPASGVTDDEEEDVFEGYDAYRPRWRGDGSYVTYAREDDSGYIQVYVSEVGGEEEFQLTDGELDCANPVFNPEGNSICFQIDDTVTCCWQIAKVEFNPEFAGGEERQAVPVPVLPVPGPGGAQEAVSAAPGTGNQAQVSAPASEAKLVSSPSLDPKSIGVLVPVAPVLGAVAVEADPAKDDEIEFLTDSEYDHENPEWSPDGSDIVCQRDDDDGYVQVFRVPTNGSGEAQLTFDNADHEWPSYLDENTIIYVKSVYGEYDQIYKLDLQYWQDEALTDVEADHGRPAPASNGNNVVFEVEDDDGMTQIGRVCAAGGDEEYLTEEDIDLETPDWSPDNENVFCVGWRYPGTEIGLVDGLLGGYEAVTDSEVIRLNPDVSYDGLTSQQLVVFERVTWDTAEMDGNGLDGRRPPRRRRRPRPGTGIFLIRVSPRPGDGVQGTGTFQLALTRMVPNPSIGRVAVRWQTPVMQRVSLKAFDVTGRLVRTLVDDEVGAGVYDCVWNCTDTQGRKLASGIYFLSLSAGGEEMRRKVVIAGAE